MKSIQLFLLLLAFAFVASQYVPNPAKWRPIDGYGHNPNYPLWGTPGRPLLRKGPSFYGDDISSPRTAVSGNPLPSPRVVSNNVFRSNVTSPKSRRALTDFVTYWGQFIDHDFTLSSGDPAGFSSPPQYLPIQVPAGDPFFDPHSYGNITIPFERGAKLNYTGIDNPDYPWTPINLVTAWFDGSNVYGSDNVTASCLRAFTGGLLRSQMINGEEYPPFNNNSCPGVTMQSANIANQDQLFLFGDVRGNENPGLAVLQIIFFREHNRRARELATEYPDWTDEQLYQESRKFVIAIMHHITEEEYLPITLGEHFEEYQTVNYEESPDIFADFSTGAFRYGHSEVNSLFPRLDNNSNPIAQGPLSLLRSYFNPIDSILSAGVDPIVRGMLTQAQNAVDVFFIDDLRNYLFGRPGSGGLDLTAINIQRSRDHGLPGFNGFRDNYELPPYTSWSQINPDPAIWQSLAATYESIDDCDIYVCGLAEVPYNTLSNVGETFHAVIKNQYHIIRDSDPFWYEADGYLTDDEETEVRQTTLAELIKRNTNLQANEVQCLVMALPDGCGANIPITPPSQPVDFVVTLEATSPTNPLFGLENDLTFSINGENGVVIPVTRGRNYTFYTQTSCSHAFYIATTPDITAPPFSPAYPLVQNQYACMEQNSILTLTVDDTTPSTLYYACILHNFMGGMITVSDATVAPAPTVPATSTPLTSSPASPTTSPVTVPKATSTSNTPIQVASGANATNGSTIALAVLVPLFSLAIIGLAIAVWVVYRRSSLSFNRKSEDHL